MEYWNSTAELTGTGRPVDGVFCPLAQHAAVKPNEYGNVGYTTFINFLDYTSISIPVTFADQTIDVCPAGVSPADLEPHIDWNCKFLLFYSCGFKIFNPSTL